MMYSFAVCIHQPHTYNSDNGSSQWYTSGCTIIYKCTYMSHIVAFCLILSSITVSTTISVSPFITSLLFLVKE